MILFGAMLQYRTTPSSSQRTGNTWYPTRIPWPRVVMHRILMFVSNSISTFRSHVHVIPVGWALLHYITALLTVVWIKNRYPHFRRTTQSSMTKSGYAMFIGVCIKTDFHISAFLSYVHVIFLVERCCNRQRQYRGKGGTRSEVVLWRHPISK